MWSSDYDAPAVCTMEVRKARVRHECIECPDGILPGEHYRYTSGLDDVGWFRLKMCARCVLDLARVYQEAKDWPAVGYLRDGLAEFDLEPSPITYRALAPQEDEHGPA